MLLKNAELIIYDRAGWQADQGNMAKGITMANNQTPGCEIPAAKFWAMTWYPQEVRTEKTPALSERETFLCKYQIH